MEENMFSQLFKYKVIRLLRNKSELFWSLFFPLILGTLFYVSFSNFATEEDFQSVDIAYIAGTENKDSDFEKVLQSLSESGENQIVHILTTSESKAKKMLESGEIAGVIYNTDQISLTVNGEGINESILNSFLKQYLQKKQTIMTIAAISPDKVQQIIQMNQSDINSLKEISFTNGSMDSTINYYYSLIAMSCLYGCFAGLFSAVAIKANLSTLAARRIIAPTNKSIVILGDFAGTVVVQFICATINLIYLIFVLKINFGHKLPYIIVTIFVGSIIGIASGLFVGSIGQKSEKLKMSFLSAFTMLECFLSGLMVNNMKDIVEHYAPIVNKINPAALMVDAFYSLSIYDTYDRFMLNIGIMLIIASLLFIVSFMIIRRERYASI